MNRKLCIRIFFGFLLSCCLINPILVNNLISLSSQPIQKESNLQLSNSDTVLLSPENKTYNQQSGDFLNSYDFEDIADFVDTYGRIDELDGHKNILKIRYGYAITVKNQFSQENGTIEFYFRTEDATDKTIMSLMGTETTPHIYFYVLNDDWYYLDNDTFSPINLSGYKPSDNKWHHIKIEFEASTGEYAGLSQEKWRLTVDDYSSGQLDIHRSEISPPPCIINQIWLASYVNIPEGASYFDAFGYSWDDNYQIGDNKKQGLFVNFQSSIEWDEVWYSLDGSNITIYGNTTIPMPDFGSHAIQIFLNDSLGDIYQSALIHFVIGPIVILTPSKDTVWEEGKTYEIIWSTFKNITYIDIEIYKGEILKYSTHDLKNNGSYQWSIPEGISRGTDWKVKIIDSSNSTHFGISEYFEVLTAIRITAPTSGTIWYSGKPQLIKWDTLGNISHVNIEIYKGIELKYSLVNDTKNNGKYTWLIPFEVSAGLDWNIKVIDSLNASIYDISDYFEIFTNKTITITNPSSGTHWERGTSQYITWTSTGNISNVNIEIYNGLTLKYEFLETENDEAKYWEISPQEDVGSNWNIRITDSDNITIYDQSGNFEIYHHPDILVTNPRYNSRWEADKSYFISWSVAARTNISDVNIELYNGLQLMYNLSKTENDGQYLWDLPYDPIPNSDWRVKIVNSNNLSMYGWSSNFEIFTDKSITITNPTSSSSWGFSNTYTIKWISSGSISHVNIKVFKGAELKQIFYDIENKGEFTWRLPYFDDPGSDWRINISASDYIAVYGISPQFQGYIVRVITVLAPNKSISIERYNYFDIVWTTNGSISFVRIDLYKAGSFLETIKSRTVNDGRYLWQLIQQKIKKADDYTIKISDADDSNVYDFSDEHFEIVEMSVGWIPPVVIVSVLGLTLPLAYFTIKKIKKRRV